VRHCIILLGCAEEKLTPYVDRDKKGHSAATRSFGSGIVAAASHCLLKLTTPSAALLKRPTSPTRCTQKYEVSKFVGFHTVADFVATIKSTQLKEADDFM
jgi:hypothetical protein